MKKALVITLLFSGILNAQIVTRWGSYITLEHPAIGESSNDGFNEFGRGLAATKDQLIIGAPRFNRNGAAVGAIFYLQATANKPLQWVQGNARYTQASIPGASPESGDQFGSSVAIQRTSNNESKVIIGVPKEDIGDIEDAGMIHELFIHSGGPDFLNYHQGMSSIQGDAEDKDRFGNAVVFGDFDNDNNWDVAIGAYNESVLGFPGAGSVNIIMGGSDGILNPSDDDIWSRSSVGIQGQAQSGASFGYSLAVGDFNDDNFDDLAIGVPGDEVDDQDHAGSVHILYGSSSGLRASGDQLWSQNSSGIEGGSEAGDRFGESLAVGDFNNDDVDDLAIGIPEEDVDSNTKIGAGAVAVLYGKKDEGLTNSDLFISQAESGFSGVAENGDRFGAALAVGDFNRDRIDDLVIGIPEEDLLDRPGYTALNEGSVVIVHGSNSGLQFSDEIYFTEDQFNIPGGYSTNRQFGYSLAVADLDKDGKDDLVIGNNVLAPNSFRPESVLVAYQFDHDLIYENSMETN